MEIGLVGTAEAVLQQQYAAVKTPQQEYSDQARVRAEPPRASEAPKVFVNAQGQKTGTIISVTA